MRLGLLLGTVVAVGVVTVGVVAAGFVAGCSGSSEIAELVKREGPFERRPNGGVWGPADAGARFYLGDAAQTGDGPADLKIRGGARLRMRPNSVLHFGGIKGSSKIKVEAGGVELIGNGEIGIDVGDLTMDRRLRLDNGTVTITAGPGGAQQVELIVGKATIMGTDGETALTVGVAVDVSSIQRIKAEFVDAGAAADAAVPDAAVPIEGSKAEITVVGRGAEIQAPGEKAFKKLPAGKAELLGGSKIRLTGAATATLKALGMTLELGRNSTANVDEAMKLDLELGTGTASVPVNVENKVAVPGGGVLLKGTPDSSAAAKLDVNKTGTTVSVLRGIAMLTGADGTELAMSRGEKAALARAGSIRVLEEIPKHYDFAVNVGDKFWIHDPTGATAVQFAFGAKCREGGVVEVDKNGTFKTPKISAGKAAANHMVRAGSWFYRLRCVSGDGDAEVAGGGRITVIRDSGKKPLPGKPPENRILESMLGKTTRASYQSEPPNLKVFTGGRISTIKVTAPGKEPATFTGLGGTVEIPGSSLAEGTNILDVEKDGVKLPRPTAILLDFDNTAPQVYIESPPNAQPWSAADIPVKGSVLQGWSVWVAGTAVKVSDSRRFSVNAPKPSGRALAIRLAHPRFGVHYYLRREN